MESSFIRKLFLIWRSQRHQSRIIVGEINKKYGSYSFKYDIKGVNEAAKLGFINYPDFPIINIEYTNVLDIFSQRLNDLNRSDIDRYFDFWEIDKQYQYDKYYLLAQTQGILSTDNFEILAEYYLKKDLAFISEIAGISNYDIKSDFLEIGDNLNWSPEPNNIYDPKAIVVKKGNTKLGYVKIVHNLVFHDKRAVNLKIRVKDIEKNGKITRAFISIRNI